MLGTYKPYSYTYYFLVEDLERITRLLATGGVKMQDLGNTGCCGISFLSRKELDNALVEYENRKKQRADEETVRPIERTIIPTEENLEEQQEEKISLVMGIPETEYRQCLIISPYHGKPLYWGWKSWTKRLRVEYEFD